jgi:hypothetical protein
LQQKEGNVPLSDTPLNREVFERIRWQEAVAESDEKECDHYSRHFFARAGKAERAGDEEAREAFAVLGGITSMMLHADSREEPFRPMMVFSAGRSAVLEDFTDNHLNALGEVVGEASDPELRARIGDVLWCRKRDHRAALLALKSYLGSAANLRSVGDWLSEVERAERAIALAAELGRPDGPWSEAVGYVEGAVREYEGVRFDRPRARFMELLQKYRAGDSFEYAALAVEAAARTEEAGCWAEARRFWQLEARWREMTQDPDGRRSAFVRAAETHVGEAEDELARPSPSYITASSHLESAIEGLRRAGKTRERVEELHGRLLEYQLRTRDEMVAFSQDMDMSKFVDQAREQVKGKPLGEALLAMVHGCTSPSKNHLRMQAEESSKDGIWMLMERSVVDERGRVTGRMPSFLSDDPEEAERAIRAEMLGQANHYRQTYAVAFVHPAWRQVNLDHAVRLGDLLPVVADNPFVPEGHEDAYARGLLAGFRGDFLTATHLLVPQLENSIRHVLSRSGVIVSKLDDSGIQEEKDLGALLREPKLEELLGEDLVFDLQGLLVERFGANLRNRMAHGLMTDAEFTTPTVLYLWWIVLRICVIYTLTNSKQKRGEGEEAG